MENHRFITFKCIRKHLYDIVLYEQNLKYIISTQRLFFFIKKEQD